MRKLLYYIVTNLLGLTGNLYLSEKKFPRRTVIDPSFMIIYNIIMIALAIFFASIIANSHLSELKELSETEKFWVGVDMFSYFYAIVWVVTLLFRWFGCEPSKYKVNGQICKCRCVPVISWKTYCEIDKDNIEETRQLKRAKYDDNERDLYRELNNMLNK